MSFEVQQTRWDRLIRRVSGSVGPGSRVSETLSELFPVLDVERVPGELLILGGTRLAWGGVTVAAVAAESAKIQLFNPADSANLITVTRIDVGRTSAGVSRFTMESSARPDAATSARYRDSRLGVLNLPIGQVRSESSAVIVPAIGLITVAANINVSLRDDNGICVLAPDAGLVVDSVNLNATFTVTFFWRERPAEESELQF